MQWFDVDKEGLAKLLERRGPEFVVYELIQNGLDQDVTRVDVTLEPIEGKPFVRLVVEDDDPQGFADLAHSFTLFAESTKKGDPLKRGRYNLGEKLVLAMCREATISTTKGTVRFDDDGRHRQREKRARGSRFEGVLRMSRERLAEASRAVARIIPPEEIALYFNGALVPTRPVLATVPAQLETEAADAEGVLRRVTRKTDVRVYEPLEGEAASIYELGLPVVETGDRWHYNVLQKVPLNMDRDNVPPAYLRTLRTIVFNALHDRTSGEDCTQGWVRDALGDKRVAPEAVTDAVRKRFGDRAVVYDPSDPEANKLAVTEGYAVVPGGMLSANEWANVRSAGAMRPAGQVTPSPKPFTPGGKPLKIVPEDEWTDAMRRVAAYARKAARAAIASGITVEFAKDAMWPFGAVYSRPGNGLAALFSGKPGLIFNLGRLGGAWCDKQAPAGDGLDAGAELDELLIHELAHHYEGDHLSADYHKGLCRVGAALKRWALGSGRG